MRALWHVTPRRHIVIQFFARLLVSFVVVLACAVPLKAQQTLLGDRLLPRTTAGAVLVTNVEQLDQQWDKTQLGQLMAQPAMKPFAKDLRRQLQGRFARLRARLGLSIDDLRGVPSGELDLAVVRPSADKASVVLLADITGHETQARELLDKVSANLNRQGAKKANHTADGVDLLLFDVPANEDFPAGQVVYFLDQRNHLLGASDDLDVMKGILARRTGQVTPGSTLGDHPDFRRVMARCQKHAGRQMPQLRWFIEPLAYMESVRLLTPEKKRKEEPAIINTFKTQGLDAIRGVGGFVDFKTSYQGTPFDMVHRTAVCVSRDAKGNFRKAPEPYKNVVPMETLTFPNTQDFSIPDFIPNDVATCTLFQVDLMKAFDHSPPMIDQIYGEGEPGIWYDVLDSLRIDPYGPHIDVRNDLVANLGNRLVVTRDYVGQNPATSERLLVAVKIKPGADEKVWTAINKWLRESDPTIKHHVFEGIDLWETVEGERMPLPSSPDVQLPTFTPDKKNTQRPGPQGQKQESLFPHRTVAVYRGYLLIASHFDFMTDILTRAKSPKPLSAALDYRQVGQDLRVLGAGDDCVHAFSRTDEQYQASYELLKQGKMPEAETLLARALNALLHASSEGGLRSPEIDGSKMPAYDMVRKYLGLSGTYVHTETDGWFIVGFMAEKK